MSRKPSRILSNTEEVIKCGNIDDLERHIEEIKANRASNRCSDVPNLIILACKHSKIEILKFLLTKNEEDLCHINGTTIKPHDLDNSKHNAFYYAIRSGNMDLLKTLITDWPGSPFSNNLEKLDDILSQAYDELKLKNIPLSKETQEFVESQLIDLRFFSYNTTNSTQSNLTNIIKRIELVVENIDLLSAEYSNDQDIDERFWFIAKCIAQNIFVLKRQLRSTYKTLPWEEIEFCLIHFTLAHIKQHKNNIFYHSVLNTSKLLKYVNLFSKKLKEEQTNLETIGIGIDVEKLAEKPKQTREYTVKKIIQICPQFEDLYKEYQQIRDIHSLSKMSHYIKLSLAVDPKEKEGKLVIKRTLMVIGEHTKNTLESPKLSKKTQDLLLFSLSSNTNKNLKGLRDSLAHTLSNIDNTEDFNYFIGIQQDCEQLLDLIEDVLYKSKINKIKFILKEIANEDDDNRIREMSKILIYCKDEIFKVNPRRNLERIKTLIEKIRKNITHPTDYETKIIKEVDKLVESAEIDLSKNRIDNINSYIYLVRFDHLEGNPELINLFAKYKARALLDNISPDEMYEVKIALHCLSIYQSFLSRMQTNTKEFEEIYYLVLNIFFICSFITNDVKSIKEFENKLREEDELNMNSNQKMDKFPEEQLNVKLVDLRQDLITLLESTKRTENKSKFQAVVEELVFRMLTLFMVSKTCMLENNYLSFDDNSTLLIGKSLRNHLAHDNGLVDLLTSDPLISVVLNAKKLIVEDLTSTTERKTIGRTLPENLTRVTNNFHCGLEIISNQRKMFSALQNISFDDFQCCLREGADVFGRCSRMRTALHYASMGGSLDIVKYLFDQNVLADAKDIHGNTVLHIASEYGRTDIVEYLLENKKVVKDELTELKETALHLAAEKGHTRTVELLLDFKANVNIQNVRNHTPHQKAVIHNRKDVVETLLKKEGTSGAVNSLFLFHLASMSGNLDMVEYLLTKGANINAINNDDETPLHVAARHGNLVVVNFLIKNKAEVKAEGKHGCVPLHFAAVNGHVAVVEKLIKYCEKINAVDFDMDTPLHYAIRSGHENVVDIFLKNKAKTEITNVTDQHLLHLAVFLGNLNIINALLDNGIEINSRDLDGNLPLHVLVFTKHGNASEIAEVLIRNGNDINARDNSSNTLLHLAAFSGNTELMEYLVTHGADVNSLNSDSSTPLHCAVFEDNLEAVKILVINKALINEKDKRGLTPFLIAADKGYTQIVEYLLENKVKEDKDTEFNLSALGRGISHGYIDLVKVLLKDKYKSQINHRGISDGLALLKAIEVGYKDVVEILIENGADVNSTKSGDVSPLCCAIKLNRMEIIKLLVSKGANVDGEGGQPIVEAVEKGYNDIVEYLLQKKASINTKVLNADTNLLNLAVSQGHKDVVSTLIKYGADVKETFSNGLTALHSSVRRGNNDIIKILIEKGADINAKNDFGTPLQIAVATNNLECVKTFINSGKANMEIKARHDYTLLHIAAERGNIEMVEYLVNNGSDINAKLSKDACGLKAIHIAAKHGFVNIVEFFLNNGLSVNERDSNNFTPLHLASIYGQLELEKWLITKNAVDAQVIDGLTLLKFAVQYGNNYVVELLQNGPMYNAIGSEGKNVLQHTSSSEITSLLASNEKLFEAVKKNNRFKVEASLKEGAIINSKNREGFTPLYYATIKGFNDIVDVLLKNKANPNAVNTNGFTALHYAVQIENKIVLRFLLSNGAHVAKMTSKGNTALHIAVLKNNIEIVEILLQHARLYGLNEFIDAKTKNSGSTALHVAAKNNSLDIIKLLLKNGAAYDATNLIGEVPSSVSNDQHVKFFLKQIENLFNCVKSGNSEAISMVEALDTDDLLTASKARNKEGLTLLQVAIINKWKNIAEQLVNILKVKQ